MSIHLLEYSIIIVLWSQKRFSAIVLAAYKKSHFSTYLGSICKRLEYYIMQDKLSTNKLINSWNLIQHQKRALFLIGYSFTGKTTFAELVKKHIFHNPTPNLEYENGKYNLQGVISSKSYRLQTIYPSLYSNPKEKQEVKLLDIPSFALPPDSKKWSSFQQKITIQYMMSKATKAGFLLFVDEKNTKTNAMSWKKAILSFLELFQIQSFNDDLINSIAFVFTKTPPQISQATMVNRIKQLQPTLKSPKLPFVDKLLQTIVQNNRILLVRKNTGNKAEEQDFLQFWRKIEKLDNYSCKKQSIKNISWTKEGEDSLSLYLKSTQAALHYLTHTTKIYLQEDIHSQLDVGVKRPQGNYQDTVINQQLVRRLEVQNKKGSTYLAQIQQSLKIASQFQDINRQNIKQLIEEIINFNFYTNPLDQRIFQTIFEGLQFLLITKFKQSLLLDFINDFKQLLSARVKQKVLMKLIKAEQGNKNKQFYQFAIKAITQSLTDVPEPLVQFIDSCKNKLISYSNPKQALKMYLTELMKQKNAQKKFKIAQSIGAVLRSKGLLSEAGTVFKSSSNIWEAISCLKEAAAASQQNAKEYISYLIDVRLYEQARSACYQFFSKFGFASRPRFQQSLAKIDESFKKYQTQKRKISILQDISSPSLEAIKRVVNESLLKI